MRVKATLLAGLCAGAFAIPAHAQSAGDSDLEDPQINSQTIIVTAQRREQKANDVGIAVSAEAPEKVEPLLRVAEDDAKKKNEKSQTAS